MAVAGGSSTYVTKVSSLTYDFATDAWSDEVEIADGTNPDIGIDGSGNAVAVWIKTFHWDDPLFPPAHDYYGVGSATRPAGGNWDTTFIGAGWDPKGNASEPKLAVTPDGDAMVIWRFTRGTGHKYNINAAYLPAGDATWIEAGENVTPDINDAYSLWRVVWGDSLGADALTPKMALDPNGKATLVYCMSDGTRFNVYSRSFTNADRLGQNSGWSQILEIDSTDSSAYGGLVTVAGTGSTMTVWYQSDSDISAINKFWYLLQ